MHDYRNALQRAFNRKQKSAISPVIASIILIAVTIAVAIAVAGFVFGLFGTFSGGPQFRATSWTLDSLTGDVTVAGHNSGTNTIAAVRVDGASLGVDPVPVSGTGAAPCPPGTTTGVPGNSDGLICATLPTLPTAGTAYTVIVGFNDGSSMTLSIVAV